MKLLAERSELTCPLSELATSPLERRRPVRAPCRRRSCWAGIRSSANIRPLLALRQSTSADDTHLIHVVRMALRDQLKIARCWSRLETLGLTRARSARHRRRCDRSAHSTAAAAFLLAHLQARTRDPHRHFAAVRPSHRALRRAGIGWRASLSEHGSDTQRRCEAAPDLLRAIQEGAQERGRALDETRGRGARLASELLDRARPSEITLGIDVVRDFGFRDMQARSEESGRRAMTCPSQPRMHAHGSLCGR